MKPTPPPLPPTRVTPAALPSAGADAPRRADALPGILAVKYPLRLVTAAGEESVGEPPTLRAATENGGTSGAGDTTRTAGYVADLSKVSVPQPGPPVVTEPTLLAGPESRTPPPGKTAVPTVVPRATEEETLAAAKRAAGKAPPRAAAVPREKP